MTDRPLRLALVGCGRLAEVGYRAAFDAVDDARVVAVADPDPTRRNSVAAVTGAVPGFADLDALLGSVDVDAVVLASPAHDHVAGAELAVAAGRHVLVEKPPAPDLAGAERLARLGELVRIGFNRRFDPGARRVRRAVAERARATGTAGVELDLVLRYRRRSWAAHTVHDDVLADLGPHLVDWACWIGGDVRAVTATHVDDDRARLVLETDLGRARIEAASDRWHFERLVARTPGGDEVAAHRAGGPVAAVVGRLPLPRRRHPLVESLADQLRSFATAVRGRPTPELAAARDGVVVMAAIDAARRSAAAGGTPVPVAVEVPPC